MADTESKLKEPKKIVDVTRPSATPTSRPIIVSSGSLVHDPTTLKSDPGSQDQSSDSQLIGTHQINIEPTKEIEEEIKKQKQADNQEVVAADKSPDENDKSVNVDVASNNTADKNEDQTNVEQNSSTEVSHANNSQEPTTS